MKINYLLVVPLILIGISVFGVSLYMASLSGVMSKMGLVGGDFRQAVHTEELEKQVSNIAEATDCSIAAVVQKIPRYLSSRGVERVLLSGDLGGERIICGIGHVRQGNVERGVYTIVKGMYYLKTHYSEMRTLIEQNHANCSLLMTPDYSRWVEAYLGSTEGRIHEVVLNVYKQVESARGHAEELCID